MLKVFLVNHWYISIENILRESIKVFLRRPPRVRDDLDEALLSSKKVIINENTLIISGHWRLKMVWWSASTEFLLLQHISLLKLSKLNISSFSLLLSNFLSKRPLPLHSISMDLPKKLDFSLHLQTCQSSVYAVRCLDFGNSTGRTAPSAKVKVVLVQQIHQHHPQKQLLA